MGNVNNYLEVWDKAIALSMIVFELSRDFPKSEQNSFSAEIKKCSAIIISSIAEREYRTSKSYSSRLWNRTHSAIIELETFLILADKYGFIKNNELFLECIRSAGQVKSMIQNM